MKFKQSRGSWFFLFFLYLIVFSFCFFFFPLSAQASDNTSSEMSTDTLSPTTLEALDDLKLIFFDSVTLSKDPNDPNFSAYPVTSSSLPMTLTVKVLQDFPLPQNSSLKILPTNNQAVLYRKDGSDMVSSFDYSTSTFTFNNLSYTGTDNQVAFLLYNDSQEQIVFYRISQLSPNTTDSDISVDSSGNSSLTTSSKNSSSSSASKNTSTTTASSSTPTSLTPHLLPISFTYDTNITGLQPFLVKVTLKNMSETLTIENAVVSLTSDKSTLSIVDSSMVEYIRALSPGATHSFTIYCVVSELTQSVSFSISSSLEYYDIGKTSPSKSTDKATIPISFIHFSNQPDALSSGDLSPAELRLESITLPENTYDNLSFSLGYRIANIGASDVSHVDLSLTNSNGDELARLFLGVLKYGQIVDSPDIPLTFGEDGTYSLTLTAYYRDGYGNQKKTAKAFQLVIEPQENADRNESSTSSSTSSTKAATVYVNTDKKDSSSWIFWLLCFLIVGITAFAVYKLRTDSQGKKDFENTEELSLSDFSEKDYSDPPDDEAKHFSKDDDKE